jgi:hypothetical protein
MSTFKFSVGILPLNLVAPTLTKGKGRERHNEGDRGYSETSNVADDVLCAMYVHVYVLYVYLDNVVRFLLTSSRESL